MCIEINNHVIHLGKSQTNIKTYYLKSHLKLSNTFVTYPFGSTKTRYQHVELFSYVLETIHTDIEMYTHYNLTVTKTNITSKNCPHNGNTLCSSGWDIDLKALNVVTKDINNEFVTLGELYELLPKDYGSVDLSIPDTYAKPVIGIVVPIYNRYEYVEKFFDSITGSNIKNCILILIDESLTKDIDDDKIKVNDLVKKYVNKNVVLIKIYKNKHGNMFESILTGFDLLGSFCEYFSTIDSDTIHKKDWIDVCLNTYKSIDNYDNVLLSGFNTVSTEKHTIIETKDNYVIKNSIGGCHMFFSKNMYYGTIRHTLISYKWDTNIINILHKMKSIIITTKPSVVEHIGYVSSGHRTDINTIYDSSLDFYKTHIIIIGNIDGLKQRTDKNMYNFFCYIKQHSKYIIILCETTEYDTIRNIGNSNNSLIIINSTYISNELRDCVTNIKCKKIYMMEDLICTCKYKCDGTTKFCKFIPQHENCKFVDYIFYKFHTYITTHYYDNAFTHFKFPYYFNNNIMFSKSNKKYDILFYGAIHRDVYPFRHRLYNLLKTQTDVFNIKILERSKKIHKSIYGNDLHKLINESWITIVTKSIQNDLLLKYYEISMCSSVVCGDYPDLETEQYLKNNMIYIDMSMTNDQILNIITNCLNDKQTLETLSVNNHNYFVKNYSYSNGLTYFEKLMDFI